MKLVLVLRGSFIHVCFMVIIASIPSIFTCLPVELFRGFPRIQDPVLAFLGMGMRVGDTYNPLNSSYVWVGKVPASGNSILIA